MIQRYTNRLRDTVLIAVLLLNFWPAPVGFTASADYGVGVSQKLGRGLLNVVSSPFEIPCTIRDDASERGGAGIASGLFKGVAFFVRRALVGVCEVGTFVIPMEATLPAVCAKKEKPAIQT